jgi:PhnB protein
MTDPIPEHQTTVTPRLVVGDGEAAIAFYREAFGAEEVGERFAIGGRLIHAVLKIGTGAVLVTEDGADQDAPARSPEALGGRVSAIMATYWDDPDAVWERALAAGAEVLYPLDDQFYGERSGRLRDPFGHQWMISKVIEELSAEEMHRRADELFGG